MRSLFSQLTSVQQSFGVQRVGSFMFSKECSLVYFFPAHNVTEMCFHIWPLRAPLRPQRPTVLILPDASLDGLQSYESQFPILGTVQKYSKIPYKLHIHCVMQTYTVPYNMHIGGNVAFQLSRTFYFATDTEVTGLLRVLNACHRSRPRQINWLHFLRFIRKATFTFSVMWKHSAGSQCIVVVLT